MNFLAHLHLAGTDPQFQLGGLYGDFVKGPLQGQWPEAVEGGIRHHRRIDAFTDSHPIVLQARARFPRDYRRVAGILLDLFFDHRLAVEWTRYADEPLDDFTAHIYTLLRHQPVLPGRLSQIAPRLIREDWLGSYRTFETLPRVVVNMSRRLSRPMLLIEGGQQLHPLYEQLTSDFERFYPELQTFAYSALVRTDPQPRQ